MTKRNIKLTKFTTDGDPRHGSSADILADGVKVGAIEVLTKDFGPLLASRWAVEAYEVVLADGFEAKTFPVRDPNGEKLSTPAQAKKAAKLWVAEALADEEEPRTIAGFPVTTIVAKQGARKLERDGLLEAFSGKNFAENDTKTSGNGQTPCPCCGKAVSKRGMSQPWVEVVYLKAEAGEVGYGAYFRTTDMDDDAHIADSHGCFPVGPSCLRKLKKAAKAKGRELELLSFDEEQAVDPVTTKEAAMLNGILDSDFGDSCVGSPVWSWSAGDAAGIPAASRGGIIASLVKKGLAHQCGEGDEATIFITEEGAKAIGRA